MNKTVVVYQSKYGSTKKYAEWISEELSCDLFERKDVTPNQLEYYETIIYGGGLYAGGVSGIKLITKSFKQLKNKNIIIFTCGLADPKDRINVKGIREGLNKVLSEEMKKVIKIFHLRGAIDYSKLGIVHKSMMSMLYKMTLKKKYESLREEEKEMIDTYGKVVNFIDKDTIKPIVLYVKNL
ncbi:flavodoxin domain-containing protein [uncultured Clostridium sp.]|uniref:flavodoxin domain-containing protein n=1 Tax=uncultured Clostridium sp. TaxID=59620 RepID=UPI0028EF5D45|nr:flavodoxin domain-containing protein [uncultured Clostridium sp.]